MPENVANELIGSPEEAFNATLEKYGGIQKENDYIINGDSDEQPRANFDPNSINQAEVSAILKARLALLKAKRARLTVEKKYAKAENQEQDIWDCEMALATVRGDSSNTDPLHRAVAAIVAERKKANDSTKWSQRIKAGEEYGGNQYKQILTNIDRAKEMKDKLADSFLTRVVSVTDWKNAPAVK